MTAPDPYAAIDEILTPWAKAKGFRVGNEYRDDVVRSILFYDQFGNQRAQIWLSQPENSNTVVVFAVEFRPDLPQRWGERVQVRSSLADLGSTLDELSKTALDWAGPGAFT